MAILSSVMADIFENSKTINHMRILFYGSFTAGGTERITFNLASALAETSDYEIYVMNTRRREATFTLSPKVIYCYLHEEVGRVGKVKTILGLRRFIKHQKFDVVVSIEALTGIILIPATIGLQCKTIVWEHANYFQTQGSRWTRPIRKIWLWRAAAYVVLTKRDKINFETYEKPRCPIIQIYNPVKIKSNTEYDISSKRIMSAGHLLSIKQFHLIPQIFAPIASKYIDWTWHIYGEGPERARIEAEIGKYGLQSRVILEGATREIDAEYAKAAVYVLTSRMEGLPTVLIEAQMHHQPCVAFDIETGPDEIIADKFNGRLVPAYDCEIMAEAISSFIDNEATRRDYSKNSTTDIARFDSSNIANQWITLLKRIMA